MMAPPPYYIFVAHMKLHRGYNHEGVCHLTAAARWQKEEERDIQLMKLLSEFLLMKTVMMKILIVDLM